MHNLKSIEKKQNIIFLSIYKDLYQSGFKGIDGRLNICTNEETIRISKFLNAEEMNNILEEFFDFWDYELAMVSSKDAIFYLYDNIDELFLRLK